MQALSVATPQGPNEFPPTVQIQGVANCSLAEKLIPNMGGMCEGGFVASHNCAVGLARCFPASFPKHHPIPTTKSVDNQMSTIPDL